MFNAKIYIERREQLKKSVKSGIIYLPGNEEAPMNYAGNTYTFRQDSSFLYYFGLDKDGLAAVIDLDSGEDIIFGDDRSIDDMVWMGPEKPMSVQADEVGVKNVQPAKALAEKLNEAKSKNRTIHYLPQYRYDNILNMANLLGIDPNEINKKSSVELTKAVIEQRAIKSKEEVDEIEKAVDISYDMNTTAMRLSKPGLTEREVYGTVAGIAISQGSGISFPVIFSIHGETLHNHHYNNVMEDGHLLVLDSGAESEMHYASDITRTFPVSGKFTDKQKAIYNTVLSAQMKSIEMMAPGVKYKDVHLNSAKIIVEGLKDVGLMKGNVDDAVAAGAHAMFYPHGLGHMMGLDVHDLEGLGEDYVGYDENTKRSDQFGLAYLRMGKELQPGHVMTVEPGIYFIPQLFENWKTDKKHTDFIDYDKVESYMGFGGVRIEDDVLITDSGKKVLGNKPIPKTVEDVEATCNS